MNRKLDQNLLKNIKEDSLRKQEVREQYRSKHFSVVVKNITHIRQFTTQMMLIAGSLAVFSINVIESPVVKIKEFFTGAFVLLLVVVGFGTYQLKSILERENNQLEAQNKDYISGFNILKKAEDQFLTIILPKILVQQLSQPIFNAILNF